MATSTSKDAIVNISLAGTEGFDLAANQTIDLLRPPFRASGGQSPLGFVVLHPSTHTQSIKSAYRWHTLFILAGDEVR